MFEAISSLYTALTSTKQERERCMYLIFIKPEKLHLQPLSGRFWLINCKIYPKKLIKVNFNSVTSRIKIEKKNPKYLKNLILGHFRPLRLKINQFPQISHLSPF